MPLWTASLGICLNTSKKSRKRRIRRNNNGMGGIAMFEDTDLPLALIMEEILGWEKKPGQDKKEETNGQQDETGDNQQISSTFKKY